jgi:16S rRNA (adenine1518-N6/adenine1519-N6)-dimethyltransferase
VIQALFRPPSPGCEVLDVARFRRLVKGGFAQRRKTLRNSLEGARVAPAVRLVEALRVAAIDGGRRGETLTVAEWAALERALGPVEPAQAGATDDSG